jgi:hypothetical protein
MRRIAAFTTSALLVLCASSLSAKSDHVRADLVAVDGSGVSGFVQITQIPGGGSNINVVVHGLTPGTDYASFYYESGDCTEPADPFAEYKGGAGGTSEAHGKIDDDVDEVGSVSVRLGPGYGTLLACAKIH